MTKDKFPIEAPIKALIEAIRNLHSCKAIWVESVPREKDLSRGYCLGGGSPGLGLRGILTASRCYAWSYVVDDSGKRKFFAVLHQGPVDSPLNAGRAAIVAETRGGKQ